eukprot:TRINITY_DN13307_c0_g1_i4.p2 TRINITY_DN13307_c0_g1~~TRINITY_DN13307_c0_g1_i4.p2  ORF type:complete len:205 (+),score=56.19 TRINITY_DN13307_c0_g1_i4:155-769(+)
MGANANTEGLGYRITSIDPDSPLSNLGIEPMLDFIVYADVVTPFEEYLSNNENKETTIKLYNIVTREFRELTATPRKWQGEGLLGVNVRFEDYVTAHARAIHVLNFYVNSPLHKAGFVNYKDYILGTDESGFDSIEQFKKCIASHDKKDVTLWVYNAEERKVRKTTLRPDKDWGGQGMLGGDIGFGALHSLPSIIASEGVDKKD